MNHWTPITMREACLPLPEQHDRPTLLGQVKIPFLNPKAVWFRA
jgi:hypothetical protein